MKARPCCSNRHSSLDHYSFATFIALVCSAVFTRSHPSIPDFTPEQCLDLCFLLAAVLSLDGRWVDRLPKRITCAQVKDGFIEVACILKISLDGAAFGDEL